MVSHTRTAGPEGSGPCGPIGQPWPQRGEQLCCFPRTCGSSSGCMHLSPWCLPGTMGSHLCHACRSCAGMRYWDRRRPPVASRCVLPPSTTVGAAGTWPGDACCALSLSRIALQSYP
eukprot:3429437-Rhodomonas_salina.2